MSNFDTSVSRRKGLRGCAGAVIGASVLWSLAFASDFSATDHLGADLVLTNGDSITGLHTNVGTCRIDHGNTVTAYGSLRVEANSVEIAGCLSAIGMGYPGGEGLAYHETHSYGYGPYGGIPNYDVYAAGGYHKLSANGDFSTDTSVTSGSGGAGGSIPVFTDQGQPGLNGGGSIELVTSVTMFLSSSGVITADGQPRAYDNPAPQTNGAGAGGGILLYANPGSTVTLSAGSKVSSLGSDSGVNGGTVKIFGGGNGYPLASEAEIHAGRLYTSTSSPARVDLAIDDYWGTTNHHCSKRGCVYWDYMVLSNYGKETLKKFDLLIFALPSEDSETTGKPVRRHRFKNLPPGTWELTTFVRTRKRHSGQYLAAELRPIGEQDENLINNRWVLRKIPDIEGQ